MQVHAAAAAVARCWLAFVMEERVSACSSLILVYGGSTSCCPSPSLDVLLRVAQIWFISTSLVNKKHENCSTGNTNYKSCCQNCSFVWRSFKFFGRFYRFAWIVISHYNPAVPECISLLLKYEIQLTSSLFLMVLWQTCQLHNNKLLWIYPVFHFVYSTSSADMSLHL